MNLGPEVLAWEADNAALQVAGDSAMAGLKAAKLVADGVLNLASFILDDIVKNVRLYIILNGLLGQYTHPKCTAWCCFTWFIGLFGRHHTQVSS